MTNYTLTADPGTASTSTFNLTGVSPSPYVVRAIVPTPAGEFNVLPGIAGSKQALILNENVHLDYGEPFAAAVMVLASSLGIASSTAVGQGATVQEQVTIVPDLSPALRYTKAIYDLAQFQQSMVAAYAGAIFDTTSFSEVINAARGQLLQETMKLADTPQGAATYGLALLENFKLQDQLFKFFNGMLSDAIQFSEDVLAKYRPTAAVADGVVISSSANPILMIGMELDDKVQFSQTEVLHAIFNGVLADGLNVRALQVEPDGTLTTWAINTRNSAVTEYQNWDFNSFAQFGNHYLGASEKGLFLLDGPRDVTDNIPTHVKSGSMSTGSKFTTLFSAYLGMSLVDDDAKQDFFLKMVAGDGREYVYAVKPNPEGMTTKVNMGKGLRSRYFSFELISTGADWDLDSIEFIPIVSKRRV